MGQTLTHGVYLPDEGERNCYNGLAANWGILDGAVGTVAAHTEALSGKAPLVHTHTKADITDFPAYGNTAGTICEGNDARLSDARTPVAHTHTKSDVTDLLNSNFIPSANNSYDLGSSSYQWNNVYAKGYYYNGVAWGLDKANVWSANQTIYKRDPWLTFKSNYVEKGVNQNFDTATWLFDDKHGRHLCYIQQQFNAASRVVINFHVENTYKNGVISNDSDATLIASGWSFGQLLNGTPYYQFSGGSYNDIYPLNINGVNSNLGTSTNKWKTLNGINPGALSLPNLANAINIDTTGWAYDGVTANSWTATVDCWVTVYSIYARLFILKNTTLEIGSVSERAGSYTNYAFVPARKGDVIAFTANGASGVTVIAYPCQGNV